MGEAEERGKEKGGQEENAPKGHEGPPGPQEVPKPPAQGGAQDPGRLGEDVDVGKEAHQGLRGGKPLEEGPEGDPGHGNPRPRDQRPEEEVGVREEAVPQVAQAQEAKPPEEAKDRGEGDAGKGLGHKEAPQAKARPGDT